MSKVWERVAVVEGDITKLEVDAIVNAASRTLLGGGGVDGAIHRAAGPALLEQCRRRNGCPPGEAKVTDGYRLPARWVVHTVGPVWRGGDRGEPALLARCYRRSLEEALRIGAQSLAFPAISTGAFGYPLDQATDIAVEAVVDWLEIHEAPDRVLFCTFDAEATRVTRAALAAARGSSPPVAGPPPG